MPVLNFTGLLFGFSVAGPAVAVRCACYRSRKKNADPYTVNLTFTMACEVELAKCSCPAGASGYCNHLMAVLKTVVALQELGYKEPPDELAPTELPQQWRRPRKRMAPEAVMNVNWRRVGEGCLLTPLQSTAREFVVPALTEEQQRVATIKLAEGLEGGKGGPAMEGKNNLSSLFSILKVCASL